MLQGLLIAIAGLHAAPDAPPVQNKPWKCRVGSIFIVGNYVTRQETILRQVPFLPGQTVHLEDFQAAERNLARINLFKGKPTVHVIDLESDTIFKDILITVEEKRNPSGFGFLCFKYLEELVADTPLEQHFLAFDERRGIDLFVALVLPPLECMLDFSGEVFDRFFLSPDVPDAPAAP